MLVSGIPQSDSVIQMYISIVFQILFHYGLLQAIEVAPCAIKEVFFKKSILYVVVCIC